MALELQDNENESDQEWNDDNDNDDSIMPSPKDRRMLRQYSQELVAYGNDQQKKSSRAMRVQPPPPPHMTAVNIVRMLFKKQTLQSQGMIPENLETMAAVIEELIAESESAPKYAINLFKQCCNNMFGKLDIDFDLLNNDYVYIKSVFCKCVEDNSSLKLDMLLTLLINSKLETLEISNIDLQFSSFECILEFLNNTQISESCMLNQIVLQQKCGLKYYKVSDKYADLFETYGWIMSYDGGTKSVILTYQFEEYWEYDNDDDDDDDAPHPPPITSIPPPVPPSDALPSNALPPPPPHSPPMNTHQSPPPLVQSVSIDCKAQENAQETPPPPKMYDTLSVARPDSRSIGGRGRSSIHHDTRAIIDMVGGLGGLGGLPPPVFDDSDDDNEDYKASLTMFHKVAFITECLTKKDYFGRILFNGMIAQVIDSMYSLEVDRGQCIMKEQEYGQNYDLKFYLIEYGVFDLYQQGKKCGIELFSTSTFGEAHLVYGVPQYVSIRAITNKCLVWVLNRSQYYQITWSHFHRPFSNFIECKLNDFVCVAMLGVGSFGSVMLVRDPYTKQCFSLKKMSKNRIIQIGQQSHVMNERSVLAVASLSDFCCKLYGIYQDQFYIYFAMEPLLGGELFTLLRYNSRFNEKIARFYFACVLIALSHLHSHNIIYRDIKPENIMLASNGYVKLVDFGLAKLRNNSVTMCGTPEYLAPEIIQNFWHGFEIDFWGLGILLYEMVCGKPPFASYETILGDNVAFPDDSEWKKPLSVEVIDMINGLLVKNPYQRLGTTANKRKGVSEIYKHPWITKSNLKWSHLKKQTFKPPYVPDIESDEDVSNFDKVDDTHSNSASEQTLYNDNNLYQWCQYF